MKFVWKIWSEPKQTFSSSRKSINPSHISTQCKRSLCVFFHLYSLFIDVRFVNYVKYVCEDLNQTISEDSSVSMNSWFSIIFTLTHRCHSGQSHFSFEVKEACQFRVHKSMHHHCSNRERWARITIERSARVARHCDLSNYPSDNMAQILIPIVSRDELSSWG